MRFQRSIDVLLTFFAALIAIGLRRLLDEVGTVEIAPYKWPALLVAVFFFLRFLSGAANYLWLEHIKNQPARLSNGLLTLNLGFLTAFGLFALGMCYANAASVFFWRAIYFLIVAICWAGLDWAVRFKFHSPTIGDWRFWPLLNVIHIAFYIWALSLDHHSFPLIGWKWSWVLLVAVGPVILVIDFILQLRQIRRSAV